jgi:hypothetical protein
MIRANIPTNEHRIGLRDPVKNKELAITALQKIQRNGDLPEEIKTFHTAIIKPIMAIEDQRLNIKKLLTRITSCFE